MVWCDVNVMWRFVCGVGKQLKTHHQLFQAPVKKTLAAAPTDEENGTSSPAAVQAEAEAEEEEEEEIPRMSVVAAGVACVSLRHSIFSLQF